MTDNKQSISDEFALALEAVKKANIKGYEDGYKEGYDEGYHDGIEAYRALMEVEKDEQS